LRTATQFIHSFISIQPLGRSGSNQSSVRALARCILDKFLRSRLPLLSPAFRRSHFCRQVPQRPQRRERS